MASMEELFEEPTVELVGGFLTELEEVSASDAISQGDEIVTVGARGRKRRIMRRRRIAKVSKGVIGGGVETIAAGATVTFEVKPTQEVKPYRLLLETNQAADNKVKVSVESIKSKQTEYLLNGKSCPVTFFENDTTSPEMNLPVASTTNPLYVSVKNGGSAACEVGLCLQAITTFSRM